MGRPGVEDLGQRVLASDAGHQLHALGLIDRAHRLRAHPPGGAENGHADVVFSHGTRVSARCCCD